MKNIDFNSFMKSSNNSTSTIRNFDDLFINFGNIVNEINRNFEKKLEAVSMNLNFKVPEYIGSINCKFACFADFVQVQL